MGIWDSKQNSRKVKEKRSRGRIFFGREKSPFTTSSQHYSPHGVYGDPVMNDKAWSAAHVSLKH